MDTLFNLSLTVTGWLQSNYPQLENVFIVITNLGGFEAYLVILPLIYWSLNKRVARHVGYVVLVSALFNVIGKYLLRGPRPYWLDMDLGIIEPVGYGVPSGHTQTATTFFFMLAYWSRRNWAWLLAAVYVFVMGLSRIYLGAHFIHDVVGGFVLGMLVITAYLLFQRFAYRNYRNRILGQRLLLLAVAPLIVVLIVTVIRLIIGAPSDDVAWAARLGQADREALEELVTMFGLVTSFGVGFLFESSRIRFIETGPWWQRIVRYLLGIVVTIGIWFGLGEIVPNDPLWLELPLRFVRYGLVGLWVSYYAPWLFVRLKLAEAAPEPEVSIAVTSDSLLRG